MILPFPSSYTRLSRKLGSYILRAENQCRSQLVVERAHQESPEDWTAALEHLEGHRDIRVIQISQSHALLSWRHHASRTAS